MPCRLNLRCSRRRRRCCRYPHQSPFWGDWWGTREHHPHKSPRRGRYRGQSRHRPLRGLTITTTLLTPPIALGLLVGLTTTSSSPTTASGIEAIMPRLVTCDDCSARPVTSVIHKTKAATLTDDRLRFKMDSNQRPSD